MNSANEANQLEMSPKPMESVFASIAKAHPMAWVVLALLVMNMAGAMPFWGVVVGSVFAWFVFSRIERERQIAEAKAVAAAFANCIGPVVVGSQHPGEGVEVIRERARFWREQLRLSGNPYAEKIPIIEYPYTPILADYGQLAAGWSTYCRLVGELQHIENLKWYNGPCPTEIKALFATAVLPAPKQEQQ